MPRVKITPKRGKEVAGKKGKGKKNKTAPSTKKGDAKGEARPQKRGKRTAATADKQREVTEFLGGTNKRKTPGGVPQLQQEASDDERERRGGERRRASGDSHESRVGGERPELSVQSQESEERGRRKRRRRESGEKENDAGGRVKRRRREGGVGGGESVGEVEEGNEGKERERGKKTREVRVTEATLSKWTPVSPAARELLTNTMVSALGHCLEELRGGKRKAAETAVQQVIQKVESEVAVARAPTSKRIRSSAHLRQRMTELKDGCLCLVSRNQEMERTLEERKQFCEEQSKTAEQLGGGSSRVPSSHSSLPDMSELDEETFHDIIQELLSHTPATITTNSYSL